MLNIERLGKNHGVKKKKEIETHNKNLHERSPLTKKTPPGVQDRSANLPAGGAQTQTKGKGPKRVQIETKQGKGVATKNG